MHMYIILLHYYYIYYKTLAATKSLVNCCPKHFGKNIDGFAGDQPTIFMFIRASASEYWSH